MHEVNDSTSKTVSPCLEGTRGTLNVILHGLVAIEETLTGIRALIPDLGEAHVYRAGTWLGEVTLHRGGTYKLDGVIPGRESIDPRRNLVFHGPPALPQHLYAEIQLPRPKAIYSLRRVSIDPEQLFTGKAVQRITSSEIATLQVLTYEFQDETKLCLTNHWWVPYLVDGVVNLHIMAERDGADCPCDEHSAHAFEAGVDLFPGLDLRVRRGQQIPLALEMKPEDLPHGVLLEETIDLLPRMEKLKAIGGSIRQYDGQLIRMANKRQLSVGLGDDPLTCTTIVVKNP